MKSKYGFVCMAALLAVMLSCSEMNDLHDKYLEGEIVYAAKVDSVSALSGRERALLNMDIRSQRIESVRIYWNDYADSADIAIGNQVGTFSKMLEGLEEDGYIFQLVSFDKFGNRSLPFEVAGDVYGERFQSKLSNRAIQTVYGEGDTGLTINWGGVPDNAVCSELTYTDKSGSEQTYRTPMTENTTLIADWSSGLRYRTLFLPVATAIDTFYTDWRTVSDIPFKYSTEGWTAASRDGNHDWGDYGGQPEKVLDGDRNTGWHSRVGSSLPQCLVVDMQESRPVHHIMLWHLPAAVSSNWIYFKTIEVYLSDTPATPGVYQPSWGEPAATYEYPGGFDGVTINLAPGSRGRYLILLFPNSSSTPHISFTELEVYTE